MFLTKLLPLSCRLGNDELGRFTRESLAVTNFSTWQGMRIRDPRRLALGSQMMPTDESVDELAEQENELRFLERLRVWLIYTRGIYLGVAVFTLTAITRYFEYLWDKIEGSLAFIITGLVLLGLVALVERSRRSWTRAVAGEAHS